MVVRLKAVALSFANRLGAYEAVVNGRDSSTDEQQTVHLDVSYPDAHRELNPRLAVVKWLVAIPHRVALFFLYVRAFIAAAIGGGFAIRFGGRGPRAIFGYVEGAVRWHNRAVGYASIVAIGEYRSFPVGP